MLSKHGKNHHIDDVVLVPLVLSKIQAFVEGLSSGEGSWEGP